MKTDKLPIAEEILKLKFHWESKESFNKLIQGFPYNEISFAMIEFAKLHVKEALEAAVEVAENEFNNHSHADSIYKDFIRLSYSLDNIK